jgi:hypothetical protein
MAKVKTFTAQYGLSIEIIRDGKTVWHKFGATVETELELSDDFAEVKEKTWNTVLLEVENQFNNMLTSV